MNNTKYKNNVYIKREYYIRKEDKSLENENLEINNITSPMIDEHDVVEIIERTPNLRNIGKLIRGDTNSNIITFKINRYYDNVDLKDQDICIIYKNSLGTFKENAVNVQYSENHLRFSWVLSYNMASVSGNVIACINFLGEDEFGNSYSLKTANFKLSIDNA